MRLKVKEQKNNEYPDDYNHVEQFAWLARTGKDAAECQWERNSMLDYHIENSDCHLDARGHPPRKVPQLSSSVDDLQQKTDATTVHELSNAPNLVMELLDKWTRKVDM